MATSFCHIDTQRSIDALNALLRGELAAVETYERAIDKLGDHAPVELRACLRSHQHRVQQLTVRIYDLGGKPAEGSGLWGAFAMLIEGGNKFFTSKSALSALEEGEDHWLSEYRDCADNCDFESRRLIEAVLLPEQFKTHDAARRLLREG